MWSTGVETWNQNLLDIGPMYPFAHSEVLWAIIGIGSWIIWHLIQGRMEKKVLQEETKTFEDKAYLEKAMALSSAETLKEMASSHAEGINRG
jgi:hypothetical protein